MIENQICQCCGMPLSKETISREPDGTPNEDYCKYCYSDGKFRYISMQQLIDFCVENVKPEQLTKEEFRKFMSELLPQLKHWKY
ncbi:MAG TPA: zinc ribbon domain-containing protein [Methanocorpusculum sp.]|nr:zinc ribbon domain-containing protein [Methanocorpusculum sp.]HJJ39786.1 zinc ribbon domain-containing protein [Methanocorpusculum sp.]HJJ49396.1 zinc ribbon domain-containing protein [Methanocorpusculum sp.]HJJ57530.1 zinc ribbon domain-containing protein [Methanocorpusculum sp.]